MNEQEIRYALAKQVPDMARGFTISTSYGDITIPAGKLADRVRGEVGRALGRVIARMGPDSESPDKPGYDRNGFRMDASIIGWSEF